MDIQPGMKLSKVNSEFYIFCTNGKLDNDHIVYVGPYNADTSISVYRVNPKTKYKHTSHPELCAKDLYFKDGILVSDEFIENLKYKIKTKEELMLRYINSNNLKVLDKFAQINNSEFKIYSNNNGAYFYSIDYAFVEKEKVSENINNHEKELNDELLKEQLRLSNLHEQKIKKEKEDKDRAIKEKENELKRIEEDRLKKPNGLLWALLYNYVQVKIFDLKKNQWDYNVNFGAAPISRNHIKMVKQDFPQMLKSFHACSKQLGGNDLNLIVLENVLKTQNPSGIGGQLKILELTSGALNIPNRNNLNDASAHEFLLNKSISEYKNILNYDTNKNWCEVYKNYNPSK